MSACCNPGSGGAKWRIFPLLWIVLITGCACYFFRGTTGYEFTGDDFTYLYRLTHTNIFQIDPQMTHFVPIGEIIGAFPGVLIGPNPLYDNMFLILFYLVAASLTVYTAYRVTRNLTVSLAAGLLFMTFSNNHEIMFWKTGRISTAMAILCTVSFIQFSRYLESKRIWRFLLANLLLLVGMLTIEQACFIVPVWGLFELMYYFPLRRGDSLPQHLLKLWGMARKYALPICIIAAILLFKVLHGQRVQPRALHVFALAITFLYYILDYNSLLSSSGIPSYAQVFLRSYPIAVPTIIAIASLVFLAVVLIRIKRFQSHFTLIRDAAFFLMWGFLTYFPLLWIMGAASRYFALPSVGITIFAAIVLWTISTYLGRLSDKSGGLVTQLAMLGLTLIVALSGVGPLNSAKANWGKASEIEHKLVESFILHASDAVGSRQYLVNVPDRLDWETDSFFIARNGFIPEVDYYLTESSPSVSFVSLGAPKGRSSLPVLGSSKSMSYCRVSELAQRPDAVVLIFDPSAEKLVPWSERPDPDGGSFVIYDSGFHDWQLEEGDQPGWRWTRGEARLTLDIGCYEVLHQVSGVNLHLAGHPDAAPAVVITAGAEELFRMKIAHSALREYPITFPEAVVKSLRKEGQITLEIKSSTWEPAQYSNPLDRRSLGVAIGAIELVEQPVAEAPAASRSS